LRYNNLLTTLTALAADGQQDDIDSDLEMDVYDEQQPGAGQDDNDNSDAVNQHADTAISRSDRDVNTVLTVDVHHDVNWEPDEHNLVTAAQQDDNDTADTVLDMEVIEEQPPEDADAPVLVLRQP